MFRKPANRLAAAAVLAALWSAALVSAAAATSDPETEHDKCVAAAQSDAPAALARAKQWSNQGGGPEADHCAAMALYDMKHYADAARGFEKVAREMTNAAPSDDARIYDQAGQAWLVANRPRSAQIDFDAALRLAPDDPDLLIDRAEARANQKRYWQAIDDLNRASDLAPMRADIYLYRAAAYRAVSEIEMASEDIARNLRLQPNNPVGLLERGNIRRLRGDIVGAHQDWVKVTTIAPGSLEAAAAEDNLARLGAIREGRKTARGAGKGAGAP